MKYQKIISIVLLISLFIGYGRTYTYAEEQPMTVYEYYSLIQKFADAYSPDFLASGSSENYEDILLNRLIVKTDSNEPLTNDYGAIGKLEGYNQLHILQYETEKQAESAFASLSNENVEYIEYDCYLSLYDTISYCYCHSNPSEDVSCKCYSDEALQGICTCPDTTSENHLSWNSSAVDTDRAFEFIKEYGITCEDVTVAVIDTGVYANHEYFSPSDNESSRICIDQQYSFVEDGITYQTDEDDHYHGTHVSGIIYDNTMENVKICPYRVHGIKKNLLTYTEFCGAIDAAVANDVDVINMSINKSEYFYEYEMKTLKDSIDRALEKNIVLIAAAGNHSTDVKTTIPARYTELITVSATTKEMKTDLTYSNYGSCVDVGAPGTDIYSTVPRIPGRGDDTSIPEAQSVYMRTSGTSMAAPLVAAAAATLKSISPDLSAAEIQRIIKETAYVPEGWNTQYGTGIVNFYNMVKAVLEPEYSGKPTIRMNSEGKIEITAPEGTDSRLYYTLDGSVPTLDNHLVYTEPFSISGKNVQFINAVCHENGKLIGEAVKYRTRSYLTLKIDYKETVNPLNADAKWYSWDEEIAIVDDEGNITGIGVGETTVTAVLESGKRINYNVCVEYTKLQWFIRIFLLGFLWY